ncbi:MAG: hypothetical protein RIQ89_1564, partial [Bacteroidota bacterium]
KYGKDAIQKINGFFSFAFYDNVAGTVLIARDRYGVKPLYYYKGDGYFCFGSELKALMLFQIPRKINTAAISMYMQLSYIPAPFSFFNNVYKLRPGHFLTCHTINSSVEEISYYSIPYPQRESMPNEYLEAQKKLYDLVDKAVCRRLISDVPLGCFLSGGVDSSIISALAAQQVKSLNTYSIGFKDDKHFDETHYAIQVANKIKSHHTTFLLGVDDALDHLDSLLHYLDEPFGDSSALNMYMLSKETRKHVTVALSGDGADELFGGYNKHRAEFILRENPLIKLGLQFLAPVLEANIGSRDSKWGNKLRQLGRLAAAAKLNHRDRYWMMACMADARFNGLKTDRTKVDDDIKFQWLKNLTPGGSLNEVLRTDLELVLQGDMLPKVDLMSMANSLEVRTPFLDFTVVDYVSGLDSKWKINNRERKKILKETFSHLVPEDLFNRPKQGFEVPLQRWLSTALKGRLNSLLDIDLIESQGIFKSGYVQSLRSQFESAQPGNSASTIWCLMVLQSVVKRHL